jgi:Na+-transporting methylmalonyl-CoA/oxaloacetate decarboxylase gamma subunit
MQLSIMERFIDPTLIFGLDTASKLTGSLVTMIMGMGTTFVVLTVICAFTVLFTKIAGRLERKEAGK